MLKTVSPRYPAGFPMGIAWDNEGTSRIRDISCFWGLFGGPPFILGFARPTEGFAHESISGFLVYGYTKRPKRELTRASLSGGGRIQTTTAQGSGSPALTVCTHGGT